ncbi:hypothetical protein CYMTET_11896 [Cymbomonas tetramitiformis]|uniref:Uncharacterized protein n=1 Tax=Cymbomonas tetramitiformis TaxID=36881 RepID=A0AAE0GLP0_9CHLO|nr:hypothetical protein CYMTET_11896 [Cymbomonas tetramitiformis]
MMLSFHRVSGILFSVVGLLLLHSSSAQSYQDTTVECDTATQMCTSPANGADYGHRRNLQASTAQLQSGLHFTTCGKTGATGPTMDDVRTHANCAGLDNFQVNISNWTNADGIFQYTIEQDGWYNLTAVGAAGGDGVSSYNVYADGINHKAASMVFTVITTRRE